MFPDEFLELRDRRPVCYMAYGLAEPHGAYNALGLDFLKARALLERAAHEHGGIVAPPFAWHVQERPQFNWTAWKGVKQPCCSSIPEDLFLRTVLYSIRAIDARGFRVGILVTGHYGGLENDMRLLCEYYLRRSGSPLRLHACSDGELIRFQDYRGDHAGVCETSQLMALRPGLVDLSRRESESPTGPWAGTNFPDGKGRVPGAELGENIVASQVAQLGRLSAELLDSYEQKDGWQAPNVTEADDIWHRFERLTRKYWWMSRSLKEWREGVATEFPGWESLGE
jgi:creatinine amidohydrolase